MAGPPNSVSLASAIPNHYFASAGGPLVNLPSGVNLKGSPVMPVPPIIARPSPIPPVATPRLPSFPAYPLNADNWRQIIEQLRSRIVVILGHRWS